MNHMHSNYSPHQSKKESEKLPWRASGLSSKLSESSQERTYDGQTTSIWRPEVSDPSHLQNLHPAAPSCSFEAPCCEESATVPVKASADERNKTTDPKKDGHGLSLLTMTKPLSPISGTQYISNLRISKDTISSYFHPSLHLKLGMLPKEHKNVVKLGWHGTALPWKMTAVMASNDIARSQRVHTSPSSRSWSNSIGAMKRTSSNDCRCSVFPQPLAYAFLFDSFCIIRAEDW